MVSVVLISQGLVVITLGCWLQLCTIRVITNKATNVIDVFFMIQIYRIRNNHKVHNECTMNTRYDYVILCSVPWFLCGVIPKKSAIQLLLNGRLLYKSSTAFRILTLRSALIVYVNPKIELFHRGSQSTHRGSQSLELIVLFNFSPQCRRRCSAYLKSETDYAQIFARLFTTLCVISFVNY